jgi:type II secretory pathway pseudopilin PulG
MLLCTKRLIYPSPSRATESGWALLFVMIAAAVLLLSLTAALPDIYQEGQREREAELIFRGTQYARAIARFHSQFQRFPVKIDDLTQLTNGMRFLRKEYTDPMTPNGKWRFIHVNGQGVLLDSKTMGPNGQGQGQSGTNQGQGGFGTSGQSGMGGGGVGQQGMGGGGFGQQGMGGGGFGQQGMGGGGFGQSGMGGGGFDQSTGGFSSNSNSGVGSSGAQQNSSFFGSGNQGGGMFIAGVASTSNKKSIRVWNQKTHYGDWEFIGLDLGALGIGTAIPGLPQGAGGQPGQAGQPGMFGQPSQPGMGGGGFGQPGMGGGGFGQPGTGGGGFGQPGMGGGGFGQPGTGGGGFGQQPQ